MNCLITYIFMGLEHEKKIKYKCPSEMKCLGLYCTQGCQQFLNSLNCSWIVGGSWKILEIIVYKDLFLKCSSILLFKFLKKLHSSFSWFIFLKLMPLYRFQLLFYDAKTFVILFLLIFIFVFSYYEIKLFKKNFQIDCFNVTCILEKYWFVLEMFLNCSWIFISEVAGHPCSAIGFISENEEYNPK